MNTIWLVTHSDRHGVANWAFSTEALADSFAERFIRNRWAENLPHEPIPEQAQEMWERWADLEPDETIEQDRVEIDACAEAPPP